MLTLIAESKTMRAASDEAALEGECLSLPTGEEVASDVMRKLLDMSVVEIASLLKVSTAMAAKIQTLAYDFPLKNTGMCAVEAFTGVVFKALGYDTLPPQAKKYVDADVRIISSLYGWLKPLDSVKTYRMEYGAALAPGEVPFSSYWRKDVTIQLVKTLQQRGEKDVLALLPGDALKCVDTKLVKRFAKIWKVDFKQLQPGGSFRTPPAGRLKALRGSLLREMAERDITSPRELLTLSTPELIPMGTPDYPDRIAFCVE